MRLRAYPLIVVLAWALAAPAPAHAACDLLSVFRALVWRTSKPKKLPAAEPRAAVPQSIAGPPPRRERPPKLPIFAVRQADIEPSDSSKDRRFKKQIVFSPELEKRTGIHKITRGRLLGSGGFGAVHEVTVEYTGGATRQMAQKELNSPSQEDLRLERESLKLQYEAAKEGDGIVPVELLIEVIGKDGPLRFVELFELGRETLDTCMRQELSHLERVRLAEIVAAQGSRILARLRALRIVHRDLKPGNFVVFGGVENNYRELLAGTAHLRLLDFGTALKEGGRHPDLRGTPEYWAPWIDQDPKHRPTDDLYALGVILVEILTGELSGASSSRKTARPLRDPRPGFSAAEVRSYFDKWIKFDARKRLGAGSPELARIDHLEQYVLRLLGSTPEEGPTEVFAPGR